MKWKIITLYADQWAKFSKRPEFWIYSKIHLKILNIFLSRLLSIVYTVQAKEANIKLFRHYECSPLVSLFYWNQETEATSQSLKSSRLHISGPYVYIYIYICSLRFPRMSSMLLESFPVSPRGFESFTRRFGSPFGAIFKRGGGWSTWS